MNPETHLRIRFQHPKEQISNVELLSNLTSCTTSFFNPTWKIHALSHDHPCHTSKMTQSDRQVTLPKTRSNKNMLQTPNTERLRLSLCLKAHCLINQSPWRRYIVHFYFYFFFVCFLWIKIDQSGLERNLGPDILHMTLKLKALYRKAIPKPQEASSSRDKWGVIRELTFRQNVFFIHRK